MEWMNSYKGAILKRVSVKTKIIQISFLSPALSFTSGFYLQEDANVVMVTWNSADVWYPRSAANVRSLAADLAETIVTLRDHHGLDPATVYCIGHSLGAHTCGHIGKIVKLGRITG